MPLTLSLSSFSSRAARVAASGSSGIRRFAVSGTTSGETESGVLQQLWNGFTRFAGFLVSNVWAGVTAVFGFSWTNIWRLIVSGTTFLLNFNWNATDAQLDEQIKQQEIALAAARGAARGATVGYLICGVLPAATLAVFNEPLALYVMKEVSEEAAEEIATHVANLINLTLRQMVRKAFVGIFKNYRNLLRGAAIGFAQILVRAGILSQESVDKANKQRDQPWSIAGALEDTIESIKDPIQQAEVEEFWEELADACIDAGYVVAGSMDAYFAQQKLAQQDILGSEQTVEITLNRRQDSTVTATP